METRENVVNEWFLLKAEVNRQDFDVACLMRRVLRDLSSGSVMEFRIFVRESLLEEDPDRMLALALAVDAIPEREVWSRVGLRGIRYAMKLAHQARAAFLSDAKQAEAPHGVLGERVLTDLESRHGLPGRRSKRSFRGQGSAHPAHKYDVLRIEFARLLSRFPHLEREISDEARELLKGEEMITNAVATSLAGA